MKIVVLDGYAANPNDISWDGLKALGELTVYDRTEHIEDKVVERIGDAEAVFINKVKITKGIVDRCKNLKFVGVLATGYNVVDTKACADNGIVVCNVPAYSTDSVAQHTFALLLEIANHVGAHTNAVYSGRWASNNDFCFWDYPIRELSGLTMGIIGYGRIGQATAKLAKAFNMNVLAYSRHPFPDDEYAKYAPLDELYKNSDIISLHCPETDESRKMINKDTISKMKDGVIILNTSRGGLINEQDLADALKSNKVAYAGADVVSEEPIKESNPLLSAPNMILTPHIAWASKEARERLMEISVENLRCYILGNPQNVVNK